MCAMVKIRRTIGVRNGHTPNLILKHGHGNHAKWLGCRIEHKLTNKRDKCMPLSLRVAANIPGTGMHFEEKNVVPSKVEEIEDILDMCQGNPEDVAQTLHLVTRVLRREPKSKAKVLYNDSEALKSCWKLAQAAIHDMDITSLSKVLDASALAKELKSLPSAYDHTFLCEIEDEITARIQYAAAYVLSSIVSSMSRLQYSPSRELQEEITQYLSMKVQTFAVKELVRLLANVNKIPRMLLKKYLLAQCTTHIVKNIAELNGNQISEVLIVFAFCNFYPVESDLSILEQQFNKSSILKESLNIRALMRLLKAYAKLRIKLPQNMVEEMSDLFQRDLVELKPKEAANLIFYFARMKQYPGSMILDKVCHTLENNLGNLHVQYMPRIAWGLAKLQYQPNVQLMDKVDQCVQSHINLLSESQLTQVIYGHALLDIPMKDDIISTFCTHLLERRAEEDTSVRNLSLVLWSLTVLKIWECGQNEYLEKLWVLFQEQDEDWLNVRAKHALHAAAVCSLHETNTVTTIPECFSNAFEGGDIANEYNSVSETQRDVSEALYALRVKCDSDNQEDALLNADFYIPDLQLAIEVDGPSHFFTNNLQPTGKTLFRDRVHRAKGWNVACIPYFEWEQLNSEEQKSAYLTDTLNLEITENVEETRGKVFSDDVDVLDATDDEDRMEEL